MVAYTAPPLPIITIQQLSLTHLLQQTVTLCSVLAPRVIETHCQRRFVRCAVTRGSADGLSYGTAERTDVVHSVIKSVSVLLGNIVLFYLSVCQSVRSFSPYWYTHGTHSTLTVHSRFTHSTHGTLTLRLYCTILSVHDRTQL